MAKGKGPGWHRESRRHSDAAKKGAQTKRTSPESHAFKQMNMAWKRADRLFAEAGYAIDEGDHRKAESLRNQALDAERTAKQWEHELSKLHNKGK